MVASDNPTDPKADKRRTGPRFSKEIRTSQRAIFQLADRLTEAWWKVESSAIYPDTGEDVRAEIFEPEGTPTGLSLDLQVKGHEDVERFLRKGDPEHLHYPLDVAHLKRWEKRPRPVAIVVWDLSDRRGYWALVRDACALLDAKDPGWRQKPNTTLLIPTTNITGDAGLARLREMVARDELPKLLRPGDDIPFELSLQFSDSPEGRAKADELTEFWEGGGELSIDANEGPITSIVDGKIDGKDALEVFGVRVPIGPVRLEFSDVPRFVEAYNGALRQALTSKQDWFQLEIPCRGTYLHWAPEGGLEDRLDALAKEQAGYFTAEQARTVGYFADYLDYLEKRNKIETVAEGVFRLVHFPPVSDVEDLVVI